MAGKSDATEEPVQLKTEEPVYQENEDGQYESDDDDEIQILSTTKVHPHLSLLESFTPPEHQLTKTKNEPAVLLTEAEFHEVTTKAALEKLVEILKKETEIGVDMKHGDIDNSERHVSIVQISTRNTDYLIDVLVLRDDITLLNEIFLDPNIVKVLFEIKKCIMWFQYDLNLYFMNIFVLKDANIALGIKTTFFRILKKNYGCKKVPADRDRSNYTVRPLIAPQKKKCRISTRYNVHMYHELKNDLLTLLDDSVYKNLIKKWNDTCKLVFEDPKVIDYNLVLRTIEQRHNCQLSVLTELDKWRNAIARNIDKHPDSVLNKTALRSLATHLTTNASVIKALCKTDLVREKVKEVIEIIAKEKRKFDVKMYDPIYKIMRDTTCPGLKFQKKKLVIQPGYKPGGKFMKPKGKSFAPNYNTINKPTQAWSKPQPPTQATGDSSQLNLTQDQLNLLQALGNANCNPVNQNVNLRNQALNQLKSLQSTLSILSTAGSEFTPGPSRALTNFNPYSKVNTNNAPYFKKNQFSRTQQYRQNQSFPGANNQGPQFQGRRPDNQFRGKQNNFKRGGQNFRGQGRRF